MTRRERRAVSLVVGPRRCGELIPRVSVGGVPAIQLGEVGEDPGYFLIDTGYVSVGSGSLRSQRLRSLLESGQGSLIATRPTATVVRPTASSEAKLAHFDSEHKDLVFQEGPLNALSLSYLSRYLVTLDLGQIYLKRAARYNCPEFHDLSGMKLLKRAGEVVVDSLEQNSAGERAGLRPGDVIVEIDGVAANTVTLLDLRRMLAEPSTQSITIRRGTATQQREIELCDGAGH